MRHIRDAESVAIRQIVLKHDALGRIVHDTQRHCVVRDTSVVAPWIRRFARWLAAREARILGLLAGGVACPRLLEDSRDQVVRSFLPGAPLYDATFDAREYFRDALRQLRCLHARGVAHNDLAKEANWICMPGNRAGIVDFQIAMSFARRSRVFRTLAREDLRHLLKHKEHYAKELLTRRQRAILAQPQWTTRAWRLCYKPMYRFLTRRILGWQDRNSAIERSI
jgi:RIO-like serine/threonine protein kinase